MPDDDPGLKAAYALKTPDDNRALYASWARSYDATFAEAMDFRMPGHVARIYREKGGEGPVLDAGAGTGLVAAALLKPGPIEIDGLDLSPEMLDVARGKGLYRQTIVADLTQTLPLPDGAYNGIVSSGTFTHGHVGPEALDELLRVAASGALFVLTVKTEHFTARGFEARLQAFGDAVREIETVCLPIYGPGGDPAHAADTALVVTMTKA